MSVVPFADVLREQEELGRWIQRFWTNLCKLGKDKITPVVLEQRRVLLERYWDAFLNGHRQLLRCKEAAASDYVQQDHFSIIEEAYLTVAAMIAQCLADSATAGPSGGGQALPEPVSRVQLPKIQLPTFSGDPLKWESFRDLFKSLVHDVPTLPDVQKLLYLKSTLTGEAAEVIRNTPITDAGYQGAWKDLQLRYGNLRLLSFSHQRALLSCPPAQQQSAAELKRLLETFRQAIRSYSALKKPVTAWDEWFLYFLSQKLDKTTHLAWETSLANSREIPSFQQLSSFLENRIQALDAALASDPVLHPTPSKSAPPRTKTEVSVKGRNAAVFAASAKSAATRKCPTCNGNHSFSYCPKFKALSPNERKEQVQQLKACFNCLTVGYDVAKCPSTRACLACNRRHHTLLHEAMIALSMNATTQEEKLSTSSFLAAPSDAELQDVAASFTCSASVRSTTLLATAKVKVEAPSGEVLEVRALLDTGSDTSLVTSWVAQALRLPRRSVKVAISGVQKKENGMATSEVSFSLRSRLDSDFRVPVRALVLRRLTALLPPRAVKIQSWPHLKGIALADPDYGIPSRVDLILGADVCGVLFQDESCVGPTGTPTARRTPFGWVLMGPVPDTSETRVAVSHSLHCRSEDATNMLLQRFWELEEIREPPPLSPEDQQCEQHFRTTHSRDATGRYNVYLPFKQNPRTALTPNRSTALRMLLNCERRLAANSTWGDKYSTFMSEYSSLGHMQAVPEPAHQDGVHYIPHHAVMKRHDPSGKIRVVFNASFQTASGRSLNDCLLAGPKLQSELWTILTRWRLFKIAFTSDIVKMFRQIRVAQEDADWQRILWRSSPDQPVQDFRLTTVTYGTACAPFLALRVLIQLAEDEQERFPLGASIIRRHSYVDDILAGANTEEEAWRLRQQVISILQAGGFELSKWASNLPEMQDLDAPESYVFQDIAGVSTLGVIWRPKADTFSLRVLPPSNEPARYTKRRILSEVASLFDPLGWAAPVLLYAKILMQDLWILGKDWDEDLPEPMLLNWIAFRKSLGELDALAIPRWTQYSDRSQDIELHGFCDASQRAYAATVYLRVTRGEDVRTTLLAAKTKVAPVKAVSIPRLELCGAVLLANLITRIKTDLDLPAAVTAWTDSSVVLSWIRGHASLWKPFIAHRVAALQSKVPPQEWRHVASKSNPADLATRGITPAELLDSPLWWTGPSWLRDSSDRWPRSSPRDVPDEDLEMGRVQTYLAKQEDQDDLLSRFWNLTRLVAVIALCFRFFQRASKKPAETGFIRASERQAAMRTAVRLSQQSDFQPEIDQLRRGKELRRSSVLTPLRPFIDDQGLLRVGGRIDQASLPYDEKHPYIIGKKSYLAILLLRDAHLRTLHGGPQLTRSLLARQYWVIHGRSLARSVIKECVRCARYRGTPATQVMGQLPPERITPQRAFWSTGVDYAGPLGLRTTPGRGYKTYKGYIALFVCLSTRAIHLEAVSDLTSASFLAAFRRFVSRRGRCATMFSDNGTVFHGADRELRDMFRGASAFYKDAAASLAADGTDWSFIPPHAPHFGGLWEAGVKSIKHHLRRVIQNSTLTFEELTTLLCQVEACVNSRPLYTLSDDPSDLTALTPAHFLIGGPAYIVPESEPEEKNISLTSRWRQLTLMRSHFWNRWRREYLQHMQRLHKWRQQRENLEVGTLVLLRDELQPPAKWPMGRVETIHPGADGQTRVATVRTISGPLTRPIVKLCPLPVPTADVTPNASK